MLSMYQELYCIISLNFHINHLGVICISYIQTLRLRSKHLLRVTVLIRGRISGFRDCETIFKSFFFKGCMSTLGKLSV